MSEENKNVELKNEELEKVVGGYEVSKAKLNTGDTFKDSYPTGVDYYMFKGATGEYGLDSDLRFIRYRVYSNSTTKDLSWYVSLKNISKYEYYKVCTEAELDAMLLK